MGAPVFLAQSFYNRLAYPDHVVAANESAAGNEAWRVGTGRRGASNGWTPTTANATAWVSVDVGRVRGADMLVLDRGHNLQGSSVELHVSQQSDFSTYLTAATATIPTAPYHNSRIDAPNGVLTPEGAWLLRFPLAVAGRYWRIYVPAMGAGLRPYIVGAYLGKLLEFTHGLQLPSSDPSVRLAYDELVSPYLWSGASAKAQRRESGPAGLTIPLAAGEVELVELHLIDLYWRGRPMWIVADSDRAERAVLAYAPPGVHGVTQSPADRYPVLRLTWAEHQPQEL